jgi:DNA-binding NarL/FixJ family response regulator
MKPKARVLVVDDHPFIREGIRFYLRNHDDFEVIGEAVDGLEAIDKAARLRPDLIIMDLSLPAMDGLETTRRVRQIMPSVKVVMLAVQNRGDLVFRAQTAGALGCLTKDSSPSHLLQALEAVQRGKSFFPSRPAANRKSASGDTPRTYLTERELEVLTLLGEGHSNKQIADRLGISIRTVEKHRENILQALGMHNAADLVRFAVSEGLVKVPNRADVVTAVP